MKTHLMIPDTQVKPGVPLDHLKWLGEYIVDKKPDVIVMIGDHADMPSLSSYSKKREIEGARIKADIEAAKEGMRVLTFPLKRYNQIRRERKEKQYNPRMVLTLGNHEYRICRYIDDHPSVHGMFSIDDLEYESFGWDVYPFLDIVDVDGIHYSHYFYNPVNGRPYGGSVETMLKNIGFTFSMGHRQGYIQASKPLNNGKQVRGLVAGSFYLHDEGYIGPQGNGHKRLVIWKNEVRNGMYDLTEVSMDYLCRRYEGVHVHEFMKKKYPDLYESSLWLKAQT